MKNIKLLAVVGFGLWVGGCAGGPQADKGWTSINVPTEAQWIRSGEPLEFEKEAWYPVDDIENLLDSEVYDVGEYKGTRIFVEVADVRPFNRLYTRFAKNKYRLFEKLQANDKNLTSSQSH